MNVFDFHGFFTFCVPELSAPGLGSAQQFLQSLVFTDRLVPYLLIEAFKGFIRQAKFILIRAYSTAFPNFWRFQCSIPV